VVFSKQPSSHAYNLNPIGEVICQHGKGVSGVIVDVLHSEAEAGQLVHGLAVIINPP